MEKFPIYISDSKEKGFPWVVRLFKYTMLTGHSQTELSSFIDSILDNGLAIRRTEFFGTWIKYFQNFSRVVPGNR